jgi:transposase
MKAYSEDLRQKIVAALERGTSKAQAAHLFDVSLSSVKRYARKARQRDSLAPKKKGSGRPPKLDENAGSRLLEEDIKERPAATVEQRRRFLEHLTGKTLSNSTVRRPLKRLGFSRKKGRWGRWSETSS